ncbi:MAG: DUF86 domain-containing protein [Candidatus Omnitrophota bacterium]
MLDKARVLTKIDELRKYLDELTQILPENFTRYQQIEKKRGCERLLQLAIECNIDICKIIVSGLRLGLPYEENDLFVKLRKNKIVDENMFNKLKQMRALRNILVHEYAEVDDQLVFKHLLIHKADFEQFITVILGFLRKH